MMQLPQPNLDRRSALLGGFSAVAGLALLSSRAQGAVRIFASEPFGGSGKAPRTLLLLQLTGGNDGLSTLVPYGDDLYHAARRELRIDPKSVLPLDDYRGLHPELKRVRGLFDAGTLAIVQGCGYPHPVRSHFKSYEIWHTADLRGRSAGQGWVGRLCDAAWMDDRDPNLVVHIGASVPYSLVSFTHPPVSFATPTGYRWAGDSQEREAFEKSGEREGMRETAPPPKSGGGGEAGKDETSLEYLRRVLRDGQASSATIRSAAARYRTKTAYPDEVFAQALKDIAALATAQIGSRVFSVELTGFDTHSDQRNRHDALMRRLDAGLSAFLEDLRGTEAGQNLVVMVFSEFGRRLHENGSRGTDHGVAGPMLVLGPSVKGGLYGKYPSLSELDEGDLAHTVDFRSVYATLIERWFGVQHEKVLSAKYAVLPIV
jgi:uncharacterized protein (DUF1501 family)